MPILKIDSHQHFWKFDPVRDSWINEDMKVIRRNFLPEDLDPLLKENGIDGCVAVQADQSENETHFLLQLATENDFIEGVVGWVDLRATHLEERLEYFSQFKKLKGFRHIVQGEPKGFLEDDSFIRGVQKLSQFNFTYDLLIYHHQLAEASMFVSKLPEVKIVLDHLAKPSIRTHERTTWEQHIRSLSSFPNVWCKVSGMVTEADWKSWTKEDFYPYLDTVLECFGTERLLYGSDWPVCLLAATYDQQLSIVESYLASVGEGARENVMGKNAERFYGLV